MNENITKRYWSYVIGFVVSLILTLTSYTLVRHHVLPMAGLVATIVTLAVAQLVVQLIFFLHIGEEKGARWKLVTFIFAIIVVVIVVGGSLWVMYHLNYNMMNMTPDQEKTYMQDNEGL